MASRTSFIATGLARRLHRRSRFGSFGFQAGPTFQKSVLNSTALLLQSFIHHSTNLDSNSSNRELKLTFATQSHFLSSRTSHLFGPRLFSLLELISGTSFKSLRTSLATRTYGTWTLSGFSRPSSSRLQPYLEVEEVIANIPKHQEVMKKRKMVKKPDLNQLADLFQKAKDLKIEMDKINKEKDENTYKVKEMLKASSDNKKASAEIQAMREKGRDLRDEARKILIKFQEVNDTLVGFILAIPNQLDPVTPLSQYEYLGEIPVKEGVERFKIPEDFEWTHINGVGPNAEYLVGPAAMLELEVATMCQKFLLSEKFTETGNVDFVKRVLLDGTGLDPKQFLRVREIVSKTGRHHATYLVGGATFPAFLALFAQSVIQQKEVLPIRYFVIGRAYTKSTDDENKKPVQDTVIQVFVACKDQEQEEEEFSKLMRSMERFYSEVIGVESERRLLPAPELESYEKKRVMYVQEEGLKTIGHVTATGDYVSKRLLCCYNDRRIPKFLHLITGQFFNITDFVRPMLPSRQREDVEKLSVEIKAEAEAVSIATKILAPTTEATDVSSGAEETDKPTQTPSQTPRAAQPPPSDESTTKKE